ncbi:DUF3324 domain-containing protein (plasmid) [Lactobacillus curvatus]|nr:DUF3324 domain-containing protein [Latilactobacillus curvatus]MSD84819.1 DUF3324 domain-containing protein [Latilactobacillus curvatus]MSE22869.1 DUF3324 domain-containing protein [Latilactobacillus curvatus]MSE24963.1 DUF3324 domain-containing protein [Latilactobacillus curvatus]
MLKKKSLVSLLGLVCLLVGISSFTQDVHAEGAEFTVSPQYGAGQTDTSLGYFSIKVEKGQSYPITVNVQNLNTQEANNFDAKLVVASTSNNGLIDYTPSHQKMVKTKAPFLPDLAAKAERNQSFTLARGASKAITFNLKVPGKGLKGTLLGSVYVKRTSNHETQKQGFGINNSFAMTVPVLISQDFDRKITPKLSLTMAKLKANSGVPQVVGQIANSEPTMFGKIKLNAWVTKKNQTKRLYQKNANKLSMAPRSTFNYAIDTNNQILPEGQYTYHVKMVSGKKTFLLKRNFTVDGRTREQINKTLINPEKSGINWWLWGSLGILLLLVIASIAYLIGRKRGAGEHGA